MGEVTVPGEEIMGEVKFSGHSCCSEEMLRDFRDFDLAKMLSNFISSRSS